MYHPHIDDKKLEEIFNNLLKKRETRGHVLSEDFFMDFVCSAEINYPESTHAMMRLRCTHVLRKAGYMVDQGRTVMA